MIQDLWKDLKEGSNESSPSVFPFPRKGCHHCYGRGYTGYYKNFPSKTDELSLCRCLLNGMLRTDLPKMTLGQFKEVLAKGVLTYNLQEVSNAEVPIQPSETVYQEITYPESERPGTSGTLNNSVQDTVA